MVHLSLVASLALREMCNNSIFMLFSASLLQLEIVQNDMETNAASDNERDQEKERTELRYEYIHIPHSFIRSVSYSARKMNAKLFNKLWLKVICQ